MSIEAARQALAAAVCANDADAVAHVLRTYPDLKTRLDEPMPDEAFGATPLLGAVHRGNRAMVDLLLDAGADVNQRSHWWAGSFGVLDHDGPLVDYLIARGATVDVHAAARHGRIERLRELLDADPSLVHARGGDGQTPLHFASSVEVARLLVDRGADPDARDVDHESTPGQWMVKARQEVARYLVERGCRTDLLMVTALGDEHRVRSILDAHPSAIHISVSEKYFPKQDPRSGGTIYIWTLGAGKTAHAIAHDFGRDAILDLLMDRTPPALELAVACELGDEFRVRELLDEHPDAARLLGADELRKLPDAARDENVLAIRLMLSAGWPIDARGQHGGTALHWAGFHGHAELTREILRHGPPLEVIDHDFGGTPVVWACYGSVHGWRRATGDYVATVELLLGAGACPPDGESLVASDAVRDLLNRRGS